MKLALYNAIASVLHPDDEERFFSILEQDSIRRDSVISNDWRSVCAVFFQVEQRALLATYLLAYLHVKGCHVSKDGLSKALIDGLNISKDFPAHIEYYIPYLPSKDFLRVAPLDSIINPSQEFSDWAESVVYNIHRRGNYAQKIKISSLSSAEYEHPHDLKMLTALKNTAGFDKFAHKIQEVGVEPFLRVQCAGSNIKVTEKNFPELYYKLRYACDILDVAKVPDLFLKQGFINAHTSGVKDPFITIQSSCLSLLSEDEMMFLIGHELGHIKSQHMLYHNMCLVLPVLGEIIGDFTLGFGNLFMTGIVAALLNWQRMSEFTADRAGLLCCQNVNAAYTLLMKIAGAPPKYYDRLDPSDFINQAKEFSDFDIQKRNKIAKFISILGSDHPWTVLRGGELSKWIDDGSFELVLSRHNASDSRNPRTH